MSSESNQTKGVDKPRVSPEALVAAVSEEIADRRAKIAKEKIEMGYSRERIGGHRARITVLKRMIPRKPRAKKARDGE